MINKQNYVYFDEIDEHVENLFILLKNRVPKNIFFITCNYMSLVIAMHLGFCGIPITKFNKYDEDDFQLNLLEHYLLKLHLHKNMFGKNLSDFGYMLEKSHIEMHKKKKTQRDMEAMNYSIVAGSDEDSEMMKIDSPAGMRESFSDDFISLHTLDDQVSEKSNR